MSIEWAPISRLSTFLRVRNFWLNFGTHCLKTKTRPNSKATLTWQVNFQRIMRKYLPLVKKSISYPSYVSEVQKRYTQACNNKVQRGYLMSLWMGLAPNHVMWTDLKSKITDASRKMSANHEAYKELLTRKGTGM